jgi:superfamily II DNA/RNA helicase
LRYWRSSISLNRNKTIRIVSLHPGQTTEQNMDDLAEGSDIVVATPDRARAIYLKLGLEPEQG